MRADGTIPVTVVTGFLGAGKTTLVNRWLGEMPRGDVAVIVNEHGDVGIDGELLAARAKVLVEITGGCVCCATKADLVRALDELATAHAGTKRILVETSGAASPAGVLTSVARGGRSGAFALDGVVTVADATRIDALREHDLALEQLGYADIVVLSRGDVAGREVMTHAADVVAQQNGAALVVESSSVSLERLLERRRADFAPLRTPHAAAAHVYESVSLDLDGDVDGERFADFVETDLARFAGRIFRTKGILAVAGMNERMIVQGVADSVEITFGAAWGTDPRRSRLVVVGFGLDRPALTKGFAACAVRSEARARQRTAMARAATRANTGAAETPPQAPSTDGESSPTNTTNRG